jgi:hypothetical protein
VARHRPGAVHRGRARPLRTCCAGLGRGGRRQFRARRRRRRRRQPDHRRQPTPRRRARLDVDDLVGRRVVALIPPELREAHVAGFTRHLTTGEAHVLGVPLRLPVLRADGTRLDCDFLIEQTPATTGRAVYIAWIQPIA